MRIIETQNRLLLPSDLKIDSESWESMHKSISEQFATNQYETFIIFLECVVKYVRDLTDHSLIYYSKLRNNEDVLNMLEVSLERGSKWKIVFEKGSESGLIERVDSNITKIAKELFNDYLTKAWNEAFGVIPKPDKAIENAQRAVELIASEKGLTNSKTGVYGNLLGDIRSNPDKYISIAKTAYDLSEKLSMNPKVSISINDQFSNWFWQGMDLIQKTNPIHHVSDKTKDFILAPEAGKQAVLIATIICQLISLGYFTKNPNKAQKDV